MALRARKINTCANCHNLLPREFCVILALPLRLFNALHYRSTWIQHRVRRPGLGNRAPRAVLARLLAHLLFCVHLRLETFLTGAAALGQSAAGRCRIALATRRRLNCI
jgi:hypothetical protein